MPDVTVMLRAVEAGEAGAEERLWGTVYQELRRMAGERMAGESREITLQATAIVHEAWLRLARPDGGRPAWEGRAHFFSAAGEAMRRILVDQARRRQTLKRGGGQAHVPLLEVAEIAAGEDMKVLQVHEALDALAAQDSRQAQIVKLIYFIGLTQQEVAGLLDVSEKTIQRQWILAKAFLFQEIKASTPPEGRPPTQFTGT